MMVMFRSSCLGSPDFNCFPLLASVRFPTVDAKNKKQQLLPDYVLRAENVMVVIQPDAGESLTNPGKIAPPRMKSKEQSRNGADSNWR